MNFSIYLCFQCDICRSTLLLEKDELKAKREMYSVGRRLFAKQARPQDLALERC